MRDIRFRAWIKEEKRMVDVDMRYAAGFFYDNKEDYEIMQYTGLKDCKGKEIYEGDILKFKRCKDSSNNYKEYVGEVTWSGCGFLPMNDDHGGVLYTIWDRDYEIIGNQYENPELLKEVEK